MTKVKAKSKKQIFKNNVFLDFLIYSHCFDKLLNSFHSEMENRKNQFLNFSVLVLKAFNEIWLALLVLQTELLFPFK